MAPVFDEYRDTVRSEWIDENQHLNMGYYVVVFDYATDLWLGYIGLGPDEKRAQEVTTFALETHVNYLGEVGEGDPLRFTTQLIDFDEKRIHYFHEMYHAEEGYLAATNELMSLHVSRKTRRAAPMAASVQRRLEAVREEQSDLELPAQVGRHVGFRQRP